MFKQNNCNFPNESSRHLNWSGKKNVNTFAESVYCIFFGWVEWGKLLPLREIVHPWALGLTQPVNYEPQTQECDSQVYEHVSRILGDKTSWLFGVFEEIERPIRFS